MPAMARNESNKPQMDCRSNQARPQRTGILGLVASELTGLTSRLQGILRDDGQANLDTCHSPTSDAATQAPRSLDDSGDEGPFLETPMTDHNFDALPEPGLHGHNIQREVFIGRPGPPDTVYPNDSTYSNSISIDSDLVPNSGERHTYHHPTTYRHDPKELDVFSTDVRHFEDDVAPVAIVGMSCRFPGDATTPERLWEMCASAREAWSEWPADRFNQDAFLHPNPEKGGTFNARGGHFLTQDMDEFDATFFNITPTEAKALDPQQRLQLESAYEALENAGISLEQVCGTSTGVFIGTSNHDYEHMLWKDPDNLPLYHAVGVSASIMANRISHFFDLTGPSLTVDTACSSSLVALHQACQSIRLGESKTAIVGGANLILEPGMLIPMSSLKFFSPDGKCYTYDHRASGYGRGEGVGTVILKSLNDAIRDGDTIRGVIRSTGVNSDGRTAGLMLPNGAAQEALIRSTYAAAGLDPAHTRYVESHGTGTKAGDPIESAAIGRVFGTASARAGAPSVRVGSIKTNIGHLENASGIAGLIKTILSVEKGFILPNSNFEKAGSRVLLEENNLKVPTQLEPWPVAEVRRASVNSFGFGGTNAHCIIDDAGSYLRSRQLHGHALEANLPQYSQLTQGTSNATSVTPVPRLFVLSANDEHSMRSLASSYAAYLDSLSPTDEALYIEQLAYTLQSRRSLLPWREAVVASDLKELSQKLSLQEITPCRNSGLDTPRLGFVFTGQGAQWSGMGYELMKTYQVYNDTIVAADKQLQSLGSKWCIADELSQRGNQAHITSAAISQPACTAVQIALVRLFSTWGIRPTSVIGHSSGEIAAAYAAGIITLESAMSIAYYRGLAIANLTTVAPQLRGAMLATGLSALSAKNMIAMVKLGEVEIACVNSPSSVTISGDEEAIDELAQLLNERNIFARKLKVEVAYHSSHMLYASNEYMAHLLEGPILPDATEESTGVLFASSLSGRLSEPHELGATYWVRNMVSKVQFSDGLTSMISGEQAGSVDTLVEIGPHSTLAGPIKQILASLQLNQQIKYVPTLIRNENACLSVLNTAQQLWKQACPVDVNTVNRLDYPNLRYGPLTDLPPYPFNHTIKHWHESRLSKEYRFRKDGRHDLLGAIVPESNAIEPRWRNILRVSDVPWLKDHIVQSTVVFPAAGYIAMAIEAKRQELGMTNTSHSTPKTVRLRSVYLSSALVLPSGNTGVEISLSLRPVSESDRESSGIWSEFKILSHTDAGWVEHCRGSIAMACESPESDPQNDGQEIHNTYWRKRVTSHWADCTRDVPIAKLDEAFENMGLLFGPTFRNLDQVMIGSRNNSKTIISIPDTASTMPHRKEFHNLIHPAVLDSCFQAAFPPIVQGRTLGDPIVPTFIEELIIDANLPRHVSAKFEVYASAKLSILRSYVSEVAVFNVGDTVVSKPVVHVTGLKTTSLAWGSNESDHIKLPRKICYTMPWRPDVDIIGNAQLSSLLPSPDPTRMRDAADSLSILEWLSYQYLTEALPQINDQDRSKMAKHHMHFYQWAISRTLPTTVAELDSTVLPKSCPVLSLPNSSAKMEAAINVARNLGAEGEIVLRIGENLVPILKGELDPLALMVQGDLLTEVYTQDRSMLRCYELLREYVSLLSFKHPSLRVLEIGAGTGGATEPILETLGGGATGRYPLFSQYTYTDISSAFFEKACSRFAPWGDMVEYRTLNIDGDAIEQGFQEGTFDLIIAANVLHATRSIDTTLSNVRRLLKPGGRLIMIEITNPRLRICLPFGTLPGWWLGENDGREMGPLLSPEQWEAALKRNGFDGLNVCEADYPSPYQMSNLIVSRATEKLTHGTTKAVSLLSLDIADPLVSGLSQQLDQSHIWQPESRDISNLGYLDSGLRVLLDTNGSGLLKKLSRDKFSAVKNLLGRSDDILWITRGAQDKNPDAAMVTGLARALRNENAGLNFVTLGLDSTTPQDNLKAVEVILRVLNSRFGGLGDSKDMEFVERGGQIQVPRLVEYSQLNELMARDLTATQEPPKLEPFYQPNRTLQLQVGTPGLLDSLHFVDNTDPDSVLDADSVEFQVKAIGLNFRDVLTALGQIEKPYPLGYDSSGIITAVGSNVSDFRVGDKVAGLAVGSFTNTLRVKAHNVFHLPTGLSFEDGASIPLAFATAYYALVDVARVSKGHKVLIHSAAGGVGQAAVKLAQLFEAEVFVTVGSDEKRQFMLDEYGIPPTHIFSSRNAGFAENIMRMTDGQGVDIVLNSLSGELLKETWRCVGMFGYFLEIGKRDIYANSRLEMRPLDNHVTFSAIDLSAVFLHRPLWGARILKDCFKLFYEGKITAMRSITTFPIDQVQSAFRFMQASKHSGKIVVTVADDAVAMVAPRPDAKFLKPDATYLIAGGAGGLGREICRWLIGNGARNVLLLSRNASDANNKVQELVDECSAPGAIIKVCKCDARLSEDVANAVRNAQEMGMPPIRGVVNGAMVLKDSLFENMAFEDWETVTDTKLQSSWNLHHQLLDLPLDFFVLLSSASGISGNRGQSNYAASSTFQDAFAHYRRSLGLPATTLDLGMIESAGYVADNQDSVSYLTSHGYSMIKLPELFSMLRHAILTGGESSQEHCQIISGYDATAAEHTASGQGLGLADPKFSHLPQIHQSHESRETQKDATVHKQSLREALVAAGDKDKQHGIMVEAVVDRLSSLLGKDPADVNENKSVASLGVDSLVAVELRNWIVGETRVSLPIFEILGAKSLGDLAKKIEKDCVFLKSEVAEGIIEEESTGRAETV